MREAGVAIRICDRCAGVVNERRSRLCGRCTSELVTPWNYASLEERVHTLALDVGNADTTTDYRRAVPALMMAIKKWMADENITAKSESPWDRVYANIIALRDADGDADYHRAVGAFTEACRAWVGRRL